MKKFKLWGLLFTATMLLISCSVDDSSDPDPVQAQLRLAIMLPEYKITKSVDGEVVCVEDNDIGNMSSLVYIVHNADNGQFVKFRTIGRQEVLSRTKDGLLIYTDKLDFGNYYVSVAAIAATEVDAARIAKGLQQDYAKAALQIPNDCVFFETQMVDCNVLCGHLPESQKEDVGYHAQMKLKIATGMFAVLLPKGSKGIPDDANFNMRVEASDFPSAFFLQTRKTLTTKETEAMGLLKFDDTFEITHRFESQVLAKYYLLPNEELEDTPQERGVFRFVYKEDAASNVVDRLIEMDIPEFTASTSDYVFKYDLYSAAKPQVETNTR